MKPKPQKKHWNGILFRILLGGFLVWMLLFDSNNLKKMMSIRKQAQEAKIKYDQQAAINDSLRALNEEKEKNPAEWEKEARVNGMQKPGESVIRVIRE